MMWGYYNWGMGVWMLVWWAILIGIIVLAVYGLVSLFNRRDGQSPMRPDPLGIIKERYARGEITAEEYHRMRDELKEK
ncbi:hypothetical protein MTCOM_06450 [Moorella thermoacetica]|uniref:SHOCT domain-containing protein n=1 Tax=Neomoorella thermoacetica TaxID=1525 RepID=UPI0030CBB249